MVLNPTPVRPPADITAMSAERPTVQPSAWQVPACTEADTEQEDYAALGRAWCSATTSRVRTGQGFAVLLTWQRYGAMAVDRLDRSGVQRGAVWASDRVWHFVVRPDSADLPWPAYATFVTGPRVDVPPRNARDTAVGLRWISQEPSGQLFTPATDLCAALTDLNTRGLLRRIRAALAPRDIAPYGERR
ncbi:hypothetical protein AB0G86_06425 [Streptomyces scabiei]|uniref:hypothetical protein n=1 Tax=Streptomyces scabiei TaxID=1930 RepID=UPI0033F5AF8C